MQSSGEPLSDSGPWLLISAIQNAPGPNSLWALNADGSGLTPLVTDTPIAGPHELQAAISPSGGFVAYLSASDFRLHDLALRLLRLPSGEDRLITSLTSAASEPPDDIPTLGDPAYTATHAIAGVDRSLKWSPDGGRLSFIGAMDGDSADVYLYDVKTAAITRLTDEADQAMLPEWSPDGRYVVYLTYASFSLAQGYEVTGIWAASADGSEVRLLDDPGDSLEELFVGWADKHSFLIYSRNAACGWHDLRRIDVETGAIRRVWQPYFNKVSYDPERGLMLLSVDEYTATCNTDPQSGLFLFGLDDPAPRRIAELVPTTLSWADMGTFYAVTLGNTVYAISPGGEVRPLPEAIAFIPQISPDDLTWAWAGQDPKFAGGLYVGPIDDPPTPVYEGSLQVILWTPDSRALFFVGDNKLYRLERERPAELRLISEGVFLRDFRGAAWVSR